MNVQKTGRLLLILALIAVFGMTAAHAAAPQTTVKAAPAPAPTKAAAAPVVTVKLGDAMLEEYHGGNPANRTTTLRGGDVAQKAKSAEGGKKHS